jgi:hypothetical protein
MNNFEKVTLMIMAAGSVTFAAIQEINPNSHYHQQKKKALYNQAHKNDLPSVKHLAANNYRLVIEDVTGLGNRDTLEFAVAKTKVDSAIALENNSKLGEFTKEGGLKLSYPEKTPYFENGGWKSFWDFSKGPSFDKVTLDQ